VGIQRHFKYPAQMCELCKVPVPGTKATPDPKVGRLLLVSLERNLVVLLAPTLCVGVPGTRWPNLKRFGLFFS